MIQDGAKVITLLENAITCANGAKCQFGFDTCEVYKGVPKLTQDLDLIENTVFSIDYVIFLLNYKVHRIGLFVE